MAPPFPAGTIARVRFIRGEQYRVPRMRTHVSPSLFMHRRGRQEGKSSPDPSVRPSLRPFPLRLRSRRPLDLSERSGCNVRHLVVASTGTGRAPETQHFSVRHTPGKLMAASTTNGNPIRDLWRRTSALPAGSRLFSILLGRMVPYTGSISPHVEMLAEGYARVSLRDRRRVRNHLRSIHAIAIMNLAEVASGLALNYSLPPDARAILTGLSVEYTRKARGTLTAEVRITVPSTSERREYEFQTVVRDPGGEDVARATARWLVGPKE